MAFGLIILGFLSFPLIYLLLRFAGKKQWISFAVVVIVMLAIPVLWFRPVCVPIENGEEEAKKYNYEQRKDKSFYVRVFQKKDGQWHHCKIWIARQFFF